MGWMCGDPGQDVARVLRPVQQTRAALVELLRAIEAAEPAIALGRALRSFPDGCRLAFWATIPGHPLAEGPSVAITADDHQQLAHRLTEPVVGSSGVTEFRIGRTASPC